MQQYQAYVKELLVRFKTEHCKHNHSCIYNCVVGGCMAFGKAFFAKLCLNLLLTLISLKRILKSKQVLKNLLFSLVNKTNFQLGLFMGLQTFLLKAIYCTLRILRKKEDGWNPSISAAIAGGISFLTLEDRTRYMVRMYLFGRALDCIYQANVPERYKKNALVPQIFFTVSSMVIAYAFFFEPEMLPMDTFKLYNNFSQAVVNDKIWHMCNVKAVRNNLKTRGYDV